MREWIPRWRWQVPHLFSIILRIRFRWRQHHLCRHRCCQSSKSRPFNKNFFSLSLYSLKVSVHRIIQNNFLQVIRSIFPTLNTDSRKDKKPFFRRRNLRLSQLKILSRFGKHWGSVAGKLGRRRQWRSPLLVICVYLSYCMYLLDYSQIHTCT